MAATTSRPSLTFMLPSDQPAGGEDPFVTEVRASDQVERAALERVLEEARQDGTFVGDVLINQGLLAPDMMADCFARAANIPRADLAQARSGAVDAIRRQVPMDMAMRRQAIAIDVGREGVVVGVVPPDVKTVVEDHAALLGRPVVPRIITRDEFERLFLAGYGPDLLDESTNGLAERSPAESASQVLTAAQGWTLAGIGGAVLLGLLLTPITTLSTLFGLVSILYLTVLVHRTLLQLVSMRQPKPTVDPPVDVTTLPVYTVLIPMYRESSVLPQLVRAIQRFDYPPALLEVKLLLEEKDHETILAARSIDLPSQIQVVVVPDGQPRGKPRACNYGLGLARGEYTVIYDAEDVPDPDQLRVALAAFRRGGPQLGCVQAQLRFYNPDQNLLTRWFASDYAQWFKGILPGLVAVRAPIPLGGTSNHFPTAVLRTLGAWDPFNVTEDADLGIRLYAHGYSTEVIASTTLEEANPDPWNWIRQRSRWTKGYIQTWLVHMRSPRGLYRKLGCWGFCSFQLIIAGAFLTQLLNPIFWSLTLLWYLTHWSVLNQVFSGFWFYVASTNFFAGNFLLVGLTLLSCLRERNHALVRYMLVVPVYWVMMSVAAWKGLIQLVRNPWYWEKTTHGLATSSILLDVLPEPRLVLEGE